MDLSFIFPKPFPENFFMFSIIFDPTNTNPGGSHTSLVSKCVGVIVCGGSKIASQPTCEKKKNGLGKKYEKNVEENILNFHIFRTFFINQTK